MRTIVFGAVLLAAACTTASTHSRTATASVVETAFEMGNNHIDLTVRAGGHDYPAVYDSGSEVSLMSAAVARALSVHVQQGEAGHGFGGDIPSGQASDVRLEIGAGAYTFPTIAVVDFTPMLGPGANLGFILGPTLLPDDVFEIDPVDLHLRWTSHTQFAPPRRATAMTLGNQGGTYTVPMTINGVQGVAGLDLGSATAVAISADYARRIGLDPNRGATRASTGVGGQFQTRATSLPRISFSGVEMTDVPVEIHAGPLPTGADINLGTPILFRYLVALDYARRRAWFTPTASAATARFTRDTVGMRVQRSGDRLTINFVSDRGPAHDAGLMEGDAVTAIDGVNVAVWPQGQPYFAGGEGTHHALALANGRTATLTLARYY